MAPAPHALTRSPELMSALLTGLDIGSCRDVRVAFEDRLLRVHDGRGRVTDIPADEVTAAVWLDEAATRRLFGRSADLTWAFAGTVVFLNTDQPVLTVAVSPLCPSAGSYLDRRQTSGLDTVAKALGVVIDGHADHPDLDLRLVRRAPRVPPLAPSLWLGFVAWTLAVAAGALGFSAIRHPSDDYTDRTVQLRLAGSLLAGGALLAWLAYGHLRFRKAVGTLPASDAGATIYTTGPDAAPTAAVAQLHLSPDHVVAWNGWSLSPMLGPGKGGVQRCVAGPDVVAFLDHEHRSWLQFDTREICPDDHARARLSKACAHAGIDFEDTPMPLDTGQLSMSWRFYRKWRPAHRELKPINYLRGWPRGEVAMMLLPWGLPFALTLQLIGGLTAVGSDVPGGPWLLATSSLEVAIWASMGISYRLWQRRVIRVNR